jgi:hypothetical protein
VISDHVVAPFFEGFRYGLRLEPVLVKVSSCFHKQEEKLEKKQKRQAGRFSSHLAHSVDNVVVPAPVNISVKTAETSATRVS